MRSEAFFQSPDPFPTTTFFPNFGDSETQMGGVGRPQEVWTGFLRGCVLVHGGDVHGKSGADLRWGRRRLFFQRPGLRRNSGRLRQTQAKSTCFRHHIGLCAACKGVAVGSRVSGGLGMRRRRRESHDLHTIAEVVPCIRGCSVYHGSVASSLSLSLSLSADNEIKPI